MSQINFVLPILFKRFSIGLSVADSLWRRKDDDLGYQSCFFGAFFVKSDGVILVTFYCLFLKLVLGLRVNHG